MNHDEAFATINDIVAVQDWDGLEDTFPESEDLSAEFTHEVQRGLIEALGMAADIVLQCIILAIDLERRSNARFYGTKTYRPEWEMDTSWTNATLYLCDGPLPPTELAIHPISVAARIIAATGRIAAEMAPLAERTTIYRALEMPSVCVFLEHDGVAELYRVYEMESVRREGQRPVTLRRYSSSHEAYIALGLLRSEGIAATLLDEMMGPIYSNGIRLQVQLRDVERAERLLEESSGDEGH